MAEKRQSTVTVEQIKEIVRAVLAAFEKPENKARLIETQEKAGSDLVKLLEGTFPAAVEIQQEVIKCHGFSPDGEGALRFTQAVRSFEKEDKEIAELAAELKRKFIPPMPRPPVFIPQDVT